MPDSASDNMAAVQSAAQEFANAALNLFAALRASPLESLGPTRARFLANFHHAEAAK